MDDTEGSFVINRHIRYRDSNPERINLYTAVAYSGSHRVETGVVFLSKHAAGKWMEDEFVGGDVDSGVLSGRWIVDPTNWLPGAPHPNFDTTQHVVVRNSSNTWHRQIERIHLSPNRMVDAGIFDSRDEYEEWVFDIGSQLEAGFAFTELRVESMTWNVPQKCFSTSGARAHWYPFRSPQP